MNNQRNQYLDILKGIAIILVVLGHCIQYGSGTGMLTERLFFNELPFRAIYSFHMPLFMLVSGYLFWYSYKNKDLRTNIINKIKGLGIPIVAWGTVDFAIDASSGKIGGGAIQIVKAYIWSIIGAPWFLWATLMGSFFMLFLCLITKERTWIMIVSIPIILLIPDKFNLLYFKFMWPYFMAGFLWNKYELGVTLKKAFDRKWIKLLTLVIITVLWMFMLYFFRYDMYIYTTKMQIIGNANPKRQLCIDLFRWGIGFVGSAMVLIASTYIRKSRLLELFGRASLGIYLTNIYINTYLLKPTTAGYCPNILINVIETVIVLFICYCCTWLLGKNRIINKVFLGGR